MFGSRVRSSYAVCGTQRSGSTMLCHALASTGLVPSAQEHIYWWLTAQRDGYGETSRFLWRNIPLAQQAKLDTWQRFIPSLHRHASKDGMLAAKLMWNYLNDVLDSIRDGLSVNRDTPHQLLERVFPGLRYIWLKRRDRARQAVSWSIAIQTGAWSFDMESRPDREPTFDLAQIDQLHGDIVAGDAGWQGYFADNGIEPLCVVYEDAIDDLQGTLRRMLDFLGVDVPARLDLPQLHYRSQSTSRNEQWARRYRECKESGTPPAP